MSWLHRLGARAHGVQGEVLASLALVMLTATGLLAALLLKAQSDQLLMVRDLVGRALIEETRAPAFALREHPAGVAWWIVSPATGAARQLSGAIEALDETDWQLAASAGDKGRAVVESGAPWNPIRFALRLGDDAIGARPGDVAVARIPPAVSGRAVLALLLVDSGIFTLLGAHMLRRRVADPLRRLGEAARRLSAGGFHARVPVEGVGEVADLASSFNEMSEALERRTNALEKAVKDLREANTQLRQARAGLERSERLAAVGRLAAGVAHEIGNPMGAILAFVDLAARDASPDGRRHLERASQQGSRVREILQQLLDLSRPPRATRSVVDLADCCEQVMSLVQAQQRYAGIEMELIREPGAAPVIADSSLVSQVLLNLLLNASDAVSGSAAPRVELRLRPAALNLRAGEQDGAPRRRHLDAVEVCIVDNGPGVAPEDRARIFDPFFTTKAPGEAPGWGWRTPSP